MAKRTILYANHLEANANMVEFAGWSMPLHYGSQLNEHLQVRQDAGMFDVSHMGIIDLRGPQAKNLLSQILANDIHKIAVGKALYSCMLDVDGGVIDDLIVYHQGAEKYRLVVNASRTTEDFQHIEQQAQNFNVHVELRVDLAIVAVQGPNARAKFAQAMGAKIAQVSNSLEHFACAEVEGYFIARTGYTGEDGFEVIASKEQILLLWAKLLHQGVKPIGLGARDSLRLEAGLNLYGNDMDLSTTPLESNLAWTVALEPASRYFNGRNNLQIQKSAGINKKLVGVLLLERGMLRHGQKVLHNEQEVGVITSGGFAPTLQESVGFARINMPITDNYMVQIRGKMHAIQVVKLPFVKNGKANFSKE